jgi:hypothetical protein
MHSLPTRRIVLCALALAACGDLEPLRLGGERLDVEAAPSPTTPEAASGAECIYQAVYEDLLGLHVDWRIETDADGFVTSWHEPMLRVRSVGSDEPTWRGFGVLPSGVPLGFDVQVDYDDAGRIVAVRRLRDDDHRVVEEERLSWRDDGGIAEHRMVRGDAWEELAGSRLEFIERRHMDRGVELIDEERTQVWDTHALVETRRTVLGDDGVVREFVDYDGDGHVDRTLTRQRTGRSLLETLADADGRVLSTRTTDFAGNGGPVHRRADTTGDGGTDVEVTWSADGATAEVVRWGNAGRWEVAHSAQSTTEDGQHIDLVEADRGDDGSLDWAARFATFEGLLVSNVQNIDGTVIRWSRELQSTCPGVVPRIAPPPFRERCPYQMSYRSCDTRATFAEPVEVVDTPQWPAP